MAHGTRPDKSGLVSYHNKILLIFQPIYKNLSKKASNKFTLTSVHKGNQESGLYSPAWFPIEWFTVD